MENKVLSIAIGEFKTKICVTNYNKKHPKVYQTLLFDTPSGCIEDGFIQDRQTLAEAIQEQLKAANINVSDAVFTVYSSKIATHEVVIPMVKTKEIKEYINAGASDYFPINVTDYVISYIVLDKIQTKSSKNYRLLVIATHNNMLLSYYELAKLLKINIISIDYLSNSILQLVQKQIDHRETSMYVQINEQNTLLYILNNGVLNLHRSIAYGAESSSDFVLNNMIRVIEYYSAKNMDHPIQTMYLTGVGARQENIRLLFQSEFGFQIKYIDELEGVIFEQQMLPEGCIKSDFLECIGATLLPIGIVPKQYAELVEKKNNLKEIIEICVLAMVTAFVLAIVSSINVAKAQEEREDLKSSIAELKKVESIYIQNAELTDKFSLLEAIDESCYCNTEKLNNLLTEMMKKLPESIVIRSFRANNTEIIMDVYIDSKDAAAMTFIQLDTIDLLADVKTEKITEEADEYGAMKLNYIITAKYASADSKEQ